MLNFFIAGWPRVGWLISAPSPPSLQVRTSQGESVAHLGRLLEFSRAVFSLMRRIFLEEFSLSMKPCFFLI